ncbi:hypothetical protein BTH42_12265 [Burkholderia sp. SRS-W-2-2016]|uniref:transposase n=1 Tax=Burkholderia sp. SRS-W-2-2016 TaxID=1926878 RepID=UPI00094B30A7|nr:transposase [Burkholderia sp. SRS-W-2-2016]OLL31392.1 hypothetical protein BTH42_12265 [Burkholderia sp. SRS-W-2-2016]
MFFEELNNDEWALLAPLVSDEPAIRLNRRGRPRAEPRIVTNAVLWILTTGEPWSRLPGRYPSGPTCRRRFEEWQLNGILLEMVRLLSQSGRSFAYIPQPAPPVTAKPAAPVAQTRTNREDTLRGVSWKSPESWQAPRVSSAPSQWRAADPIGDITRQLSGLPNEAAPLRAATPAAAAAASGAARAVWAVQPLAAQQWEAGRAVDAPGVTPAAPLAMQPAADALSVTQATLSALDATLAADGYRMPDMADTHASSHGTPSADERREPLTLSLAPRGMQFEDPRGYLIHVVVELVPNAMYRGSVEITKDGTRVERSGLVGPRFEVIADAQRFAFDWARQWIDRECATEAAALALAAQAPQPEANAVANMAAAAYTAPGYAARSATHPLSALRHVPEPMSSGSAVSGAATGHRPLSSPLEGASESSSESSPDTPSATSLSALRGPLRRYPGEAASAAVTSSASNTGNTSGPGATSATSAAGSANETTTADRFSQSYRELISHVG